MENLSTTTTATTTAIDAKSAKYEALPVAKYILTYVNSKYSPETKVFMTNLRLQKVLYFVQAQFICFKERPCFSDDMFAKKFGIEVPSVYRVFSVYSALRLDRSFPEDPKVQAIAQEDREEINKVIDYLDNFTTSKLIEFTHNQLPWLKARSSSDGKISLKDLYKQFSEQ